MAGFDLVIVETSGIGQGDAAIVPQVDVSMYVMTPEFGAASQLEKIDMLDFADFVAINKFDRKGAPDALRDVAKQVQRNREAFGKRPDEMPVFGTMASRFNDDGVTALYQALQAAAGGAGPAVATEGRLPRGERRATAPHQVPIVPAGARALSGRDRRRGARLQDARRAAGHAGARSASSCAAPQRMLRGRQAPADGAGRQRSSSPAQEREARLDTACAASCSASGRTCRRPTPATSTS